MSDLGDVNPLLSGDFSLDGRSFLDIPASTCSLCLDGFLPFSCALSLSFTDTGEYLLLHLVAAFLGDKEELGISSCVGLYLSCPLAWTNSPLVAVQCSAVVLWRGL